MNKKLQNEGIRIVALGAFGRAVGRHLAVLRPKSVNVSSIDDLLRQGGTDSQVVLAAWRPADVLCESISDLSYRSGWVFVPVVAESSALVVGPVVTCDGGACWRCWMRRRWQHTPSLDESWMAVRGYYAASSDAGPQGYLESYALIAAGRALQMSDVCLADRTNAATVWRMDMITREVTESVVVGVDDCPICGLHRPAQQRSVVEIQRELSYLWSGSDLEA